MSIFGKITGLDRDIFGLDVGHESIKVVQLKKAGSLFRLKSYGDSPCPKEPFSKDSIKDKKELSIAIKKAVTDHRISAKQLVSALPESYVFSKIIQMPKLKDVELQNTVPLEAANLIPLEPNQAYLDFQIVGENEGKYQILVVAASKTLVDGYIETIRLAGLEICCLETKPIANSRALISRQEKDSVLILDFGALTTSVAICFLGTVQITTTIPIGGNVLIKDAVDELSVNADKAEELIKTSGLKKDNPQTKKIIEKNFAIVIDKLADSVKYYQGHKSGTKINKIILTGGGVSIPGLPNYLQEKLGIKTEFGNPWQAIKNPPKENHPLRFTTAIGLAMREI